MQRKLLFRFRLGRPAVSPWLRAARIWSVDPVERPNNVWAGTTALFIITTMAFVFIEIRICFEQNIIILLCSSRQTGAGESFQQAAQTFGRRVCSSPASLQRKYTESSSGLASIHSTNELSMP